LQSFASKKSTNLEDRIKELEAKLKDSSETPTLPATEADLTEFQKNYPQAYNRIVTLIHKQIQESNSKVGEELTKLQSAYEQIERNKVLVKLQEANPELDIQKIDNSEDAGFLDWFNKQPASMQSMIASAKTFDDINYALNLYKRDAGVVKPKKPDAAGAVSTKAKVEVTDGSKKVWTRDEIKGLSLKDFIKYEAEIDTAKREGRIRE
jgi:hypothetical protein